MKIDALRPSLFDASALTGKAKSVMIILIVCTLFFLTSSEGFAMQPPPPPLNIQQLGELLSSAEVVAVGTVTQVKSAEKVVGLETRRTVEAVLLVERLLKGQAAGKSIVIEESYPVLNPSLPGAVSKDENKPGKAVIGIKAGPTCYHGEYSQGARVVVLLERVTGSDKYRPLGSGSYNRYLGEFLLETGGVKSLYYQFAEDVQAVAGSEDQFVDLIGGLIGSASSGRK
jgi:hypothetical protein